MRGATFGVHPSTHMDTPRASRYSWRSALAAAALLVMLLVAWALRYEYVAIERSTYGASGRIDVKALVRANRYTGEVCVRSVDEPPGGNAAWDCF